jgi:hypothetical protein
MNRRSLIILAIATLVLPAAGADTTSLPPAAGVGMSGEVAEVLLPGSELRVKLDPEGRSALVVRLSAIHPHGTAGHRYTFQWFAYEPGEHNLCDSLERVDGSPLGDLPRVMVRADSVLPPGPPGPLADRPARLPSLGGYRTTLLIGGALWFAGLITLLYWRRTKSNAPILQDSPDLPLAEKLRLLLEQAQSGTLNADGRARLERLVLGFWRDRLGLTDLPMNEAVHHLRDHPEAGNLLRHVEDWLHSGKSPGRQIEVAALLTPYLDTAPPSTSAAPS